MADDFRLPAWPRYFTRQMAAHYLGVSVDTFTAEVKAGMWPLGRPRGRQGGKLTWDRKLLDLAADRFAGLDQINQDLARSTPEDPAVEELHRRINEQTVEGERMRRGRRTHANP